MMRVDGREVRARGTVLDACRHAGAEVATLCADERLTRGGNCRACIVEIDGRFAPACTTPAREAMEVHTDTERLRAYRLDLGELMLAESAPGGRAGELLARWGATGERYRAERSSVRDESHVYLRVDLEKCIACRLCLRACDEIQGEMVYGVEGRGGGARIAWGGTSFAESPCVSCGACVSVCPSEAITDVQRARPAEREERAVRTTCGYCGVGCQLEVHASEEGVRYVEGARGEPSRGHLCVKGRYAHAFARHPDRLTTPLVRKDGVLTPVGWPEAIALVAARLVEHRGKVAVLSSSRCTNEENYLVQKWARTALGTNDVDCCARVCHAPSAAGLGWSFGTGAATSSIDDIERADAILVVGSNATESHPVTGARIRQAALRGACLIVIDVRRTELAERADVHLCPRPGTNVLVLNAMASVVVEEKLFDRAFIDARTEGWREYEAFVRGLSPESTEAETGVPAALVRRAARIYATAARPLQVHGLGVTEHLQGSESVMLLANLALVCGAVGREGAGVNPLRGQNNVQGAADMGASPDRLPGYAPIEDAEARARFEAEWGCALPPARGRTIPRIYDAALAGEVRAMFIHGEDVVQSDPNAAHVILALRALDFLVVQEIFLSETAKLAHVVLPAASFLEKDGTFTNGERRVSRVRRALSPPGEARADWEILLDLMRATGVPQRFASPAEIMDEIARVVPAFAGISYARLEGDGLQWPVPHAKHPGTAVLHGTSFARGRARFALVEYVPSPSLTADGDLVLVTGRRLAHYNTSSMTRRTPNEQLAGADELEIHPEDAGARGIETGARVVVESERGSARALARVTERVQPGSVFLTFHFPESGANFVTGAVVDRLSDCPEYKVTKVRVRPGA
jgi:formate dehydrogenase major subunit